jgi:hypothetical protein
MYQVLYGIIGEKRQERGRKMGIQEAREHERREQKVTKTSLAAVGLIAAALRQVNIEGRKGEGALRKVGSRSTKQSGLYASDLDREKVSKRMVRCQVGNQIKNENRPSKS